jgi:large subunit ribosomal protein L16
MVLLAPNRWKFRKQFRGRLKGISQRGSRVAFGEYGLKATTGGYLTNRQLESARKVIVRVTRKVGKIWFRVFTDLPYTRKGLEMPMGKGKGEVDTYRVRIKPGKIIFEISGVDRAEAEEVFKQAAYKLPLQTKLVERGEMK